MINRKEMNCRKCSGRCNKKGFPSVMKGSAYCQAESGTMSNERAMLWSQTRGQWERLKEFLRFHR